MPYICEPWNSRIRGQTTPDKLPQRSIFSLCARDKPPQRSVFLLDFIKHRKYVIVILLLIMSERQLNQNILCAVCILRNQPPVFMSAVFRPTVRYLCYIGILIDLGVPFDEYIFLSEYNRIFPILFPLIIIVYGMLLYS